MRLLVILDDTSFYHPDFLAKMIEKSDDEIISVSLVKSIPKKSNLSLYLLRSFYLLKISEIAKLIYISLANKVKSYLPIKNKFYSMKNVIKYYGLDYFYIYDSINKKKYIKKIEQLNPDIIINSSSLYFGKRLLSIPNICCINRHSSLLPSYGGLWPVFQAIRNGENIVGSTIHLMVDRIDKGFILAQDYVEVDNDDSVADVYAKCFEISVEILLSALNKIRNNDKDYIINDYKESYYSFPKNSHWKDLRRLKRKFI